MADFSFIRNVADPVAKAVGNQVTVNIPNAPSVVSGGMSALNKVGASAGIAYLTYKISTDIYDRYIEKDDAPLMAKFSAVNCGGFPDMPPKIQACFKEYVGGAIYRLAQRAPWETTKGFYDRFHQCFDNIPVQACGFWGADVFNY